MGVPGEAGKEGVVFIQVPFDACQCTATGAASPEVIPAPMQYPLTPVVVSRASRSKQSGANRYVTWHDERHTRRDSTVHTCPQALSMTDLLHLCSLIPFAHKPSLDTDTQSVKHTCTQAYRQTHVYTDGTYRHTGEQGS